MRKTIWITGLSGTGKSTLAAEVVQLLRDKGDCVVCLDGDQLRKVFSTMHSTEKNYERSARLSLAMQYAHLCHVIAEQGVTVVIATISMFKEVHKWNRNNLHNYFEIFLKVPIDELRRRDPKGIYRRYDSGELKHVAGLDLVVDKPENPDLFFDFSEQYTTKEMANKVISELC
jgi:cytidine diphosphoramidate kinase